VVVQPDEVERVSEGGIIIPEADAEKHQMAQSTGTLVAMGPDAFKEYTSITERFMDNKWVPFERTVTGFTENFAEISCGVRQVRWLGGDWRGRSRIPPDERYGHYRQS
jgi:hypothetical protein